jgi:hypothetical protein
VKVTIQYAPEGRERIAAEAYMPSVGDVMPIPDTSHEGEVLRSHLDIKTGRAVVTLRVKQGRRTVFRELPGLTP